MFQDIGRALHEVIATAPSNGQQSGRKFSRGSNEAIIADACERLRGMPRTVRARDGQLILIHNPQAGSIAKRAEHLVTFNRYGNVCYRKQSVLPLIARTLELATFRLDDQQKGTKIYVSKYDCGLVHCVVTQPKAHPIEPDGICGYLITQFEYDGGRQKYLLIDWA